MWIQKYPNRRLYDRTHSRHLTHEELFDLIASGRTVTVTDSRTGEVITNPVLAQLLVERDPLKLAAFPPELLHMLIRVNAGMLPALQQTLLQALAQAIHAWQQWQERLHPLMPAALPMITPLDWMLAAMRTPETPAPSAPAAAPPESDQTDALRAELARLREELEQLKARKAGRTPSRGRKAPRKR